MIRMAYLRRENKTVEVRYSLKKIWKAVPKVLAGLEWSVEQVDEETHHVRAKTKAGFMSLSSVLLIDVITVSDDATRVSVAAETPVTTITSIVDFAQGKRRIDLFLSELAKHLAD